MGDTISYSSRGIEINNWSEEPWKGRRKESGGNINGKEEEKDKKKREQKEEMEGEGKQKRTGGQSRRRKWKELEKK